MARTPVVTEEKPKRTPVVLTTDKIEATKIISDTLTKTLPALAEMMQVAENGVLDAKPRCDINPIIDGYRACARPDCGASFKPRSINTKEDDATEYYCSSDCAIHEFYRKRNLGAVPEKIVSGASSSSNRAHREEKKRKRAEAAPERDAKYGPMRKVIEVLGETKTAKKVKLECGHITAARGDQQRCRKCRPGKEKTNGASSKGTSSVEKIRPASRSEKSTPSRPTRQIHKRLSVKATRTPVKPPKRGKKGKR